jgi:hypothetical protein
MRRATVITTLAVAALAVSGCGGSKPHTTVAQTQSTDTSPRVSEPVALERAAREAISQNHALSLQVLWTNRVPASPSATAGPALAVLHKSVAARVHEGVRVRTLSERFRIVSLQLDPSYASASATVLDDQRAQPSYTNGRPRGRSVTLHERVRLELHRVGGSERFVVWKVALQP